MRIVSDVGEYSQKLKEGLIKSCYGLKDYFDLVFPSAESRISLSAKGECILFQRSLRSLRTCSKSPNQLIFERFFCRNEDRFAGQVWNLSQESICISTKKDPKSSHFEILNKL